MEKLLERNLTKDLHEFYREENEKARKTEMQLMQMIMSAQLVQDSERFLPPSSMGIVTRHKIPINIWKAGIRHQII